MESLRRRIDPVPELAGEPVLMSSPDPADRHAPDACVIRISHQEPPTRAVRPPPASELARGRVVVRELRTERPVPRRVAAERIPADAESPRREVRHADWRPPADREVTAEVAHESGGEGAESDRAVVRRIHDDRTGGEWRVFERDARFVPGSCAPRCLYFDGEGIVRRVWHYPADWPSLSPAALLALMDRPPLVGR